MASSDSFRSTADIKLNDVLDDSKRFFGPQPHPSPEDWSDEILYFLLPDRFSDVEDGRSLFDPNNDNGNALKADPTAGVDATTAASNWENAGTLFVGGTIKGLQKRLSYLQGMGVTALWVGPMFKQVRWDTNSYHGYGIQDFLQLDSHFGTQSDLRDFVKEAHSLNIRVILDIVLNHSGNVFAYQGGSMRWNNSQVFDVNCFRGPEIDSHVDFQTQPADSSLDVAVWPSELQNAFAFTRKGYISNYDYFPEYYEGDFSDYKDIAIGPYDTQGFIPTDALNTLCTVYKYWIAFADIDGFRIDTVKHMGLGPTRYFASVVHEFATSIGKNNFFLVGEVAGGRTNAFTTVQRTGLDAALGFGATPNIGYNDDIQDHLEYLPKGFREPSIFFKLFRNSGELNLDSHAWFRNKVVTMIDDHDQIRKSVKARFCANDQGTQSSMLAALGFNLCTLGIPCIYYGSEQKLDGRGYDSTSPFADRWIREAMFGGVINNLSKNFGAFRTRGVQFFDQSTDVYVGVAEIAKVRGQEPALRRGRQYLREISQVNDGESFGEPMKYQEQMRSVLPWSRILSDTEILCAINTDVENRLSAWVTVDRGLHKDGDEMKCLYSTDGGMIGGTLDVQPKNGRAVVKLTVPGGGVVMYK